MFFGGSGNRTGFGNRNENSNNKPPPPPKNKIHHFTLGFNPNIVGKKKSVKEVIYETCIAIYEKTDYKAIFYATTNPKPPPKPITNIETDFPTTVAKLSSTCIIFKADCKLKFIWHSQCRR